MKKIIYNLRTYLLFVFLLTTISGYAQIILNPAVNTGTVALGPYGNATVSVPSEALTGDNIALNITLPGTLPANCTKKVQITRSSNLLFQSSGAIPFSVVGGNPLAYENNSPLAGNDGQNFNLFFKFPNYTTCNGTVGTFNVVITTNCGGVETTYTTSVNVVARAANYWSVTKEFVAGNLTCGVSAWRIRLNHSNPNGSGLGAYKIQGTITENPAVPVISGGSFTVNNNPPDNASYVYAVSLQNCAIEGSIVTNTANYNFTLGDGTCGTMNGTVTATSPPLASPNANISFTKTVLNKFNTNLTPGCDARYQIGICNNGNVPWTNLVMTDNLNIPGITITGPHQLPSGWTFTNVGGTYTFTNPGAVLNPGDCVYFYIDFEINNTAVVGSTITNTAELSYQAAGSGNTGGGGTPINSCAGINCPVIQDSIQNKVATESFIVEVPRAIPSIKKCIVDPPNSLVPPIYQIGDTIKFSVMVGNSGSASLTTTVSDAMGMPNQNLQIIPGSINYKYFSNQNYGFLNSCNVNFGTPVSPMPFTVNANTSDLQNPTFTINAMPGICDYYKANFLIIEFEAKILPQLHGTKTNTAILPNGTTTLSSAVNYSVDQVGILAIHKKADKEIVENGQSFNYIIEVTNNGSVPLNNIVVTDMLPDCVRSNAPIRIKNGAGNIITYTSSGNIQINVTPGTQLQPGDTFTITIPVTKSGSGNCCNERVSVTANMVTSNISLSANYGSAAAPAACVRGTECCDIDGFSASIKESNGKFYVHLNGGIVPIQEVEISMIDYHVEYSEKDCQPSDMGIFGTISTTSNMLSGLLLNSGDNNTSSLTWAPGNPSVLNTSVLLDILDPSKLNLSCCDVKFSFCLKVKVKDVNCNVCEKTICYTSEQPQEQPCEIRIRDIGRDRKLCPGESITFNWTGTTPSGLVDIALFDATNGTVYQVLATAIPNTGTYTFTIPNNIPCNPVRNWMIIVKDARGACSARSNVFQISCCTVVTRCDCGQWKNSTVVINQGLIAEPDGPIAQSKAIINVPNNSIQTSCGKIVELKRNISYSFTAPDYICNPENCAVSYQWQIIAPNGSVSSGVGKTHHYSFNTYGVYKVIFIPICGGKKCDPCEITVRIPMVKPTGVLEYHEFNETKF